MAFYQPMAPPTYGGGGEGVNNPMGPDDASYWMYCGLKNIINTLSVIVNATVIFVIVTEHWKKREQAKKHCAPFYKIMATFMVTVMVTSLSAVIGSVVIDFLKVHCPTVMNGTMVVNLFSSYFSVVLIFLLGFNRVAVFCLPKVDRLLFHNRRFCCSLLILGLLMFGASVLVAYLSGCSRYVDASSGMMVDRADNTNLVESINYVCYLIPLASSLFYLRVYFHLRGQRKDVVTGKTMSMLNKAERCTLTQGTTILSIYLISLILHLLVCNISSEDLRMVLNGAKEMISMLPQLAVPASVLICSREMRHSVRNLVYRRSSNSRVSSASSIKTITVETKRGSM